MIQSARAGDGSWLCGKRECKKERETIGRLLGPTRVCKECGIAKPIERFTKYTNTGRRHERCIDCEFPKCLSCGKQAATMLRESQKVDKQWYCKRHA